MILGKVHWGAVLKGFTTAIALGFLYMIRCSVHSTALKKNVPNLSRMVRIDDPVAMASPKPSTNRPPSMRSRKFSETVDIEAVMLHTAPPSTSSNDGKPAKKVIYANPTNVPLKTILTQYSYSQFVSALVGGFAIVPSVAASPTMFTVSRNQNYNFAMI